MTLSKAAQAVRTIMKQYSSEALSGELTTDMVVRMVREKIPGAHEETIFTAIQDYGPEGETDAVWMRRAQLPQIPSRLYNPRTGEALE